MMCLSLKRYSAERNECFAGFDLSKSQVRDIVNYSLPVQGQGNNGQGSVECSN